jgi:hypothetical protein
MRFLETLLSSCVASAPPRPPAPAAAASLNWHAICYSKDYGVEAGPTPFRSHSFDVVTSARRAGRAFFFATEIAARTVNKVGRKQGRTSNRTTHGTGTYARAQPHVKEKLIKSDSHPLTTRAVEYGAARRRISGIRTAKRPRDVAACRDRNARRFAR